MTRLARTKLSASRGFTLLELLVTVGVLALLLSLGVPSMRAAAEKRQTVAAVERIYSELQLARSEAISRSQPVFFNINGGADWAIGVSNDALCDPTDNVPACVLPDMQNNNPITHLYTVNDNDNVVVNADGNQVAFFPQRGTATARTISVSSVGNNGYIANVIVRPLGQISICSPDADPAKYVTSYGDC